MLPARLEIPLRTGASRTPEVRATPLRTALIRAPSDARTGALVREAGSPPIPACASSASSRQRSPSLTDLSEECLT